MDPLPFARYHLAPGSQTVCYLPWLKVLVARRYVPSRGHLKHGGRYGSTFRGSWLRRTAFARPGLFN